MDNYSYTNQYYNGYNYDTRQVEPQKPTQKPVAQPNPYERRMFNGWGFSNFQPAVDNNYKTFSAQNLNNAQKEHNNEYKEEEDFERSVPMHSEYNFSHRNDDALCDRSAYGDMEKIQNLTVQNSYMAPSTLSLGGDVSVRASANLMSLAKPVSRNVDYGELTTDLYQKSINFKMKDTERGEWTQKVLIKAQRKTDTSLQKTKLHLELTQEDNPLFLYTTDIDETKYHSIRQAHTLRMEFHQFAEYLNELFGMCQEGSQGSHSSSSFFCDFITNTSNTAHMVIQEANRYKDNIHVKLTFEAANDKTLLQFLSKHVKEYKASSEANSIKLGRVTKELECIQREFSQINNERESVTMKVEQLQKTVQEQSERLEFYTKENQQLKNELDSAIKIKNELSEIKITLEGQNKEMKRKIEILEHDNASYKQDLNNFVSENKELRELKLDNGKNITEYKIRNEHLTNELSDKVKAIEDKQKIIDTQGSQIKQLETENSKIAANFKKLKSKLDQCASEINKGNQIIQELGAERKSYKEKYIDASTKFKDLEKQSSEYKDRAERELEDLRKKAKLCEDQKSTIDYLQRKLTEEQKLNNQTGLLANTNSRFQPSFNPSTLPRPGTFEGSRAPSLPKSTSFQPSGYKPSFTATNPAPSSDRYSFQNSQFTPAHNSPYSRYSEHKTLNGTPSASSVHSINISGLSGQNSLQSSYQIHCPSVNTASFKKEMEIESEKMNKENKSPNSLAMSLVHTTKPGKVVKMSQEFDRANDHKLSDDE